MRLALPVLVLSLFVSSDAWAPPPPVHVRVKISSALSAVRLNYAQEPSSSELESSVLVDKKDLSEKSVHDVDLSSETSVLKEPENQFSRDDFTVNGSGAAAGDILESLILTTMETVYFRRIAMHTCLYSIQQQVAYLKSLDFPEPFATKISEILDHHSFKGDLGMSEELVTFLLFKLKRQGILSPELLTDAQDCIKRLHGLQQQLLESSVETEITVLQTAQLVALAGSTLLWTRHHPVLLFKYWNMLASSYMVLHEIVEHLYTPHATLFTTAFDYHEEDVNKRVEHKVEAKVQSLDKEKVAMQQFRNAMDSVSELKQEQNVQVESPPEVSKEQVAKMNREPLSSSTTTNNKAGNDLFGNVVGAFGNLVGGTLHAVREYNHSHNKGDKMTTNDDVASSLSSPQKADNTTTTSDNDDIQALSKNCVLNKTESKGLGESTNKNEANETFVSSKSGAAQNATAVQKSVVSEAVKKEEPLSDEKTTEKDTTTTMDSASSTVPVLLTTPTAKEETASLSAIEDSVASVVSSNSTLSLSAKSDSVASDVSSNKTMVKQSSTRAVVNSTSAFDNESQVQPKIKRASVSDTKVPSSNSRETTETAKPSLKDMFLEETINNNPAKDVKHPVVAFEPTMKREASKVVPESASDRIKRIRERRELYKMKNNSVASSKDTESKVPVTAKAGDSLVDKTPIGDSTTGSTTESKADIKSRTVAEAAERTKPASAARDPQKTSNAVPKVDATVPSSTSLGSDSAKGILQKAAPKMSENRERLNIQAGTQPQVGTSATVSGGQARPTMPTKAGERLRPSNVTSIGARNVGAPNGAKRVSLQSDTIRRSNPTSVMADGTPKATGKSMNPRVNPRSSAAFDSPKVETKSFPPTGMRNSRITSVQHPVTTGSQKVPQRESTLKSGDMNAGAGINTQDLRNAPATTAPGIAANVPAKNSPPVESRKAAAANGVGRTEDTRATSLVNQPPATGASLKPPIPVEATSPVVLERSMFTKEKPVCMPNMGKFQAKVVRWYKTKGQRVEHNDLLCDIETEDFTFGVVKEDEGPAFMGEILAQVNSEGIQDGDLLCMLLHPDIPKVPQQNPVAVDSHRAESVVSSVRESAPTAFEPVTAQDEPAEKSLKISAQPKIDQSMCTKKMSIRMPNMGGSQAKVVKWYKNEGDRVDFKDLICDIESDGSIFTISNEDEITALMGKISVAEDSQGVQPGDLLCTVFLAPKAGGQSSNEGHASEKSEVPAKQDVKKTPTERKIEEQADRLPPGATITMPKKASGEATNTSSIEQELPPGATLVMASNAAKDIDISIFKDLDGRKSNKLKGEATITVPDGMKTSKPEAQVQSRTADVVQPSADEPPLPIPDVSASNNVTPVPIIGDSSPPASNAVVSASTDAMSPPGESSSNDPAPLVELDRSMFTKEKAINMPNMGKFRAKLVRWYKNPGDKVAFNDLLCDIETEDFTFGVVNEEDVPAYMGDIVVPADTEGLQDGDLLCHLLHPPAGAILNTKPPASAATANGMPSDTTAVGASANGMGVSPPMNVGGVGSQTMSWNDTPQDPMASQQPGFGSQSQFAQHSMASAPALSGNIQETPSEATPAVTLDPSLYTREMPIRMPNMGKYDAKVVRWYKRKGDPVEFNDVLCDIVTEDFTFGMVNEEENTALMGEITVPAGPDRIHDGDLLCTLMHLEQGTHSNVGTPTNLNEVTRAATDIKVKTGRGEFSDRTTGMPHGISDAPGGIDSPSAYKRDPNSSSRTPSNSTHGNYANKARAQSSSTYGNDPAMVGTPRNANGAGRVDDTRPRRTRAPKHASGDRTSPSSPDAGQSFSGRPSEVTYRSKNSNSPAAFGLGSINEVPRITKSVNPTSDRHNSAVNEPAAFGIGKAEKNIPKSNPKMGSTAGMGYLDNMNSRASAPDWSKSKASNNLGGGSSSNSHLTGLTGGDAASSNAPTNAADWSSDRSGRANNRYPSGSDTEKTTFPQREISNRDESSMALPDFSQPGARSSERDLAPPPVGTNGWPDWSQPINGDPAPTTIAGSQANANGWPDWSQPLQETVPDPAPSFPPEVELSMDGNGLELEPMPIHMPETGTGSKAKVVKWYKKEGDVVAFNDVICDIETDEFTFNMVNEDDVDALMGEIFVSEGDDVLEEGALLCTVFLPKEELYDDPPLS